MLYKVEQKDFNAKSNFMPEMTYPVSAVVH